MAIRLSAMCPSALLHLFDLALSLFVILNSYVIELAVKAARRDVSARLRARLPLPIGWDPV